MGNGERWYGWRVMTSAGQSFSVGLDDLGGDGREDNEKRGHGL